MDPVLSYQTVSPDFGVEKRRRVGVACAVAGGLNLVLAVAGAVLNAGAAADGEWFTFLVAVVIYGGLALSFGVLAWWARKHVSGVIAAVVLGGLMVLIHAAGVVIGMVAAANEAPLAWVIVVGNAVMAGAYVWLLRRGIGALAR